MAHTLNEDCLFNIFQHANQEPVLSDGNPVQLCALSPLNFAAVCRSWNTLIMHSPALWSYIYIETPEYARTNKAPMHASLVRFVRLWLKNSNDVPLSIRLRIYGPEQDTAYTDIIHMIFSEQERWREIEIDAFDIDAHLSAPVVVQCSPSLSTLILYLTNEKSRYPGYPAFEVLVDLSLHTVTNEKTSRLSELTISGYTKWGLPRGQERLSLPNLTCLSFYPELGYEFDDIISILSASPNLCFLNITYPLFRKGSANVPPRNTKPIVLPHLVTFFLSINDDTGVLLNYFLSYLSCPSLATFFYTSLQLPARPEDLQCLTSFFTHHNAEAPLVHLSISYSSSTNISHDSRLELMQALSVLLRSLRHIKTLNIYNLFLDDHFVESLTPHDQIDHHSTSELTIMLPSLESMSMGWYGFLDVKMSTSLLEEMLVSRAKHGKALHTLVLNTPGFGNFKERSDRMRALIANGLVVLC